MGRRAGSSPLSAARRSIISRTKDGTVFTTYFMARIPHDIDELASRVHSVNEVEKITSFLALKGFVNISELKYSFIH